MKYVSANDIVAVHDAIVKATGGKLGVREPGLLLSIAEKPKANFGMNDLYPDIYSKAASIYESICNYHVFIDGNKRTAVIVLYRYLYINGYDLLADNKSIDSYTMFVVNNKPELTDIAHWIKEHSKKVKI